MRVYKVLTPFNDSEHIIDGIMQRYDADGVYPVKGFKPTPERIEYLIKKGFIESVPVEPIPESPEPPEPEQPKPVEPEPTEQKPAEPEPYVPRGRRR